MFMVARLRFAAQLSFVIEGGASRIFSLKDAPKAPPKMTNDN
jgi:hypothetical protein